jgi:DNA-binding protein HU-beta
VNKAQLIDAVAERLGGSKKDAVDAVDAVLDTITREVVSGTKISITGFGSFEKVDRPARMARNPRTGERVRVKKSSVPKFRAGQAFKDVVSGEKKLPRVPSAAGAGRATATRAAATGTAKRAAAGTKKTTAKKTAKKAARPTGRRTAAKSPARKTTGRASTAMKRSTATKSTTRKSTGAAKTARKSTKKTTKRASKR